jgi:hypothetical protein
VSDPANVVRANVPFFQKRRPINAFGFGGLHLRAGPDSTVSIARISDTYRTSNAVDQLATFNPTGNVDAFISARINACESANDALLWSTIRVRRAHNHPIDPATFAQNAKLPKSPEHSLIELLSHGRETGSGRSPAYTARPFDDAELAQLQAILVDRGQNEALEFALSHALWPFALALAAAISPAELRRATDRFVKEAVAPSPLASVLKVLAGSPDDVSEENWQGILATNLSHYSGATAQNILQLERSLEARGLLAPSHVCRLLSPELANLALVGTDPFHPTISAVQMSQLVAQSITPQFHPYSLFYTMALADFGFPERAYENCTKLLGLFPKEAKGALPVAAAGLKGKLERCLAKRSEGLVKTMLRGIGDAVMVFVQGEGGQSSQVIPRSSHAGSVPQERAPMALFEAPVQLSKANGDREPSVSGASPDEPAQLPKADAERRPFVVPRSDPIPAASFEEPTQRPRENEGPEPAQKPPEKKPRQGSWLGSLAARLNPFKKGIVVQLSEHDNEMVWNGRRYVISGQDDEEEVAPPPPPPMAMTPHVSEAVRAEGGGKTGPRGIARYTTPC